MALWVKAEISKAHPKLRKVPDDDVLGHFALSRVLDFAEPEDGFCGDQEPDAIRLVHEDEEHYQ
ncbi:MAG: hypothetical protein WDO73_14705 [Ignavibacteriota bacterium]